MKINRRKILSMLGMSPALLAGASADAQQPVKHASAAKAAAGTSKQTLVTLNPKGTPPSIQLIPMAPRIGSLDGKTVYLVDTGFPGGGMLLHEVQGWLNRNMPSVNVVFRRKAGPYFDDDPVLWKEIKAKGHAAVMAVGH
jgi:hypothetical protein